MARAALVTRLTHPRPLPFPLFSLDSHSHMALSHMAQPLYRPRLDAITGKMIGKGEAGDQLAAALDNQLGVGKHPPAKQQRREQTALDKVRSRTSRTARTQRWRLSARPQINVAVLSQVVTLSRNISVTK